MSVVFFLAISMKNMTHFHILFYIFFARKKKGLYKATGNRKGSSKERLFDFIFVCGYTKRVSIIINKYFTSFTLKLEAYKYNSRDARQKTLNCHPHKMFGRGNPQTYMYLWIAIWS